VPSIDFSAQTVSSSNGIIIHRSHHGERPICSGSPVEEPEENSCVDLGCRGQAFAGPLMKIDNQDRRSNLMAARMVRAGWLALWSLLAVGSMVLAGCHSCGCH
jgi:hypothetical protein